MEGIVSERDVVRRLHRDGAAVLDQKVSDIMTADVRTCGPEDNVEHTARVMTEARVRHLPVVTDGALVAIISIGEVGGQMVIRRLDNMGQPIEGSETKAAGFGATCSHQQNQPSMSAGQGVRVWTGVCPDAPDAASAGNRITIVQP